MLCWLGCAGQCTGSSKDHAQAANVTVTGLCCNATSRSLAYDQLSLESLLVELRFLSNMPAYTYQGTIRLTLRPTSIHRPIRAILSFKPSTDILHQHVHSSHTLLNVDIHPAQVTDPFSAVFSMGWWRVVLVVNGCGSHLCLLVPCRVPGSSGSGVERFGEEDEWLVEARAAWEEEDHQSQERAPQEVMLSASLTVMQSIANAVSSQSTWPSFMCLPLNPSRVVSHYHIPLHNVKTAR